MSARDLTVSDGRIPAHELAGWLAAHVEATRIVLEQDGDKPSAEEIADYACECANAELHDAHGETVAARVFETVATHDLAHALAVHALATEGWA